jgi:murein L,D-transpeptidase YafK
MRLKPNVLVSLFAAVVALACCSPQITESTPVGLMIPDPNDFSINAVALGLPLVDPKIVVSKSRRRLMLYSNNKLVRVYRVGLGTDPVNDKVKEGDRSTPEGEFYIFTKNEQSAFYLSLGLSYPNAEDATRGLRDRLITQEEHDQIVDAIKRKAMPLQNTALGGEIYIHGNGSQSDWTWGCVALDDKDIRELFDSVPAGTRVIIEH